MKTTSTLLLAVLALGASSLMATAKDARGQRRSGSPLMAALDVNKDREIDASERANASTALASLDKNSDGKLTSDEIRPARGKRGSEAGPARKRGGAGRKGNKRNAQ